MRPFDRIVIPQKPSAEARMKFVTLPNCSVSSRLRLSNVHNGGKVRSAEPHRASGVSCSAPYLVKVTGQK